jgi:hypothetical protein
MFPFSFIIVALRKDAQKEIVDIATQVQCWGVKSMVAVAFQSVFRLEIY